MDLERHFTTHFTEALAKLYLPRVSEQYLYRTIYTHLINASDHCGVTLHAVSIRKIGSRQYLVRVNSEISIQFNLKQPVCHERESI